MPRAKKVAETEVAVEEPAVVEETTAVVEIESEAKKAFRTIIERYKIDNPKKYASKEQALLKQLNEL